jgi:1-acyl-sn-glycerol-3-phosphate acyltransferase
MTAVRSLLFFACATVWTLFLAVAYVPLFALPRKATQRGARLWNRGLLGMLGVICGLRHRVVGWENVPAGGAIFASKHQSAWDTLIYHVLLDDPIIVLKRELFRVPLVGWYMKKSGAIGIDRSAGFRAVKMMMPEVDRVLAEGSQVLVFPEGTRTPVGDQRPYHPGIAGIYAHTDAPVVPVALNSGVFWGRRSFLKYPGVITIEFLPPMPPGLNRKTFLTELQTRIETATERLCATAGTTSKIER